MLNQTDREVLVSLLLLGDNTTGNLSDLCDRHPNSIRDATERLQEKDFVGSKGSGVWCLTFQGVSAARAVVRETNWDIEIQQDWIDDLSRVDLG